MDATREDGDRPEEAVIAHNALEGDAPADESERVVGALKAALSTVERTATLEEGPDVVLRRIRAARRRIGDTPVFAAEAGACYEALGEVGLARREYEVAASLDPTLVGVQDRLQAIDEAEAVARTIASTILAESSPRRPAACGRDRAPAPEPAAPAPPPRVARGRAIVVAR